MSTSHFSVFNCLLHLLGCRCLKLVGWSPLDHRQRRHRRRVWQSSETELLTFFFLLILSFPIWKWAGESSYLWARTSLKTAERADIYIKILPFHIYAMLIMLLIDKGNIPTFFFLSSLNAAVPPSRTEDDELALSVGILYWHSTCSLDTWYAVCRTGGTWRSTQFYRVGKYVEKNFSNILCFFRLLVSRRTHSHTGSSTTDCRAEREASREKNTELFIIRISDRPQKLRSVVHQP